ncbi:MAG: CoB--CoM heterodisulfide reductase iron-sulfur subunit B family protein [Alphaproteobacteria bacterium]|nr:CoB--CoM heterodisulfide reductase iron-sulfur subunit B family protein [Alphaproteobacteria bacterium]
MRFAYYPGCSAQSTCKELNAATHVVAANLGLELIELPSAGCTGSRELRAIDPDLFLALNARLLALAETNNLPLMTVCNTCTLNFLDVNKILTEAPERLAAVNAILAKQGLHYRGTTRVSHFLWVLLEDIGEARLRARVVRRLAGLRVAAFYGCHITRPPAHFGFVDSRNARSIERINEILGCESIDYSGRTECCGFHTAAHEEKIAIKLTGRHIKSARDNGAAAIVTPCPLCHTVLDTFQDQMERDLGTELGMPILHLPQLVGLAIGLTPTQLGVAHHMVPVDLPLG